MASSVIIIKEMTGQKRELTLIGAGLPKRGANWPGRQRLVTTWYPGNIAQATQQVLGPIDVPSNWNGEWNTTRLVRTPASFVADGTTTKLAFAHDVALALEDMLRCGSLLQVTWAVDNENPLVTPQQILRQGRASEWNFAYDRIDDIVWTITWEWVGRGGAQDRVSLRQDGGVLAAMSELNMSMMSIGAAVNGTQIQLSKRTIPNSANQFTLEKLGALLDAPNQMMKSFSQTCNRISNRIATLGDLVGKAANLPFELENQAIDIATTAVQAANYFYDQCTQTPPDYLDTQERLSTLTRAASYYKTSLDMSQEMAKRGASAQSTIIGSSTRAGTGPGGNGVHATSGKAKKGAAQSNQVTVYMVRSGDTLIGISQKFYGTPDGAVDIAFSNNLPLKTISPPVGKVLIIPPYTGMGSNMKQKPGIKPADNTNTTLPNGVGQIYPYAP